MKITYTSYGKTTTIELDNDDIDIDDLAIILYSICRAQEWHPVLLKKIFKKNVTNGES